MQVYRFSLKFTSEHEISFNVYRVENSLVFLTLFFRISTHKLIALSFITIWGPDFDILVRSAK